MGGISGCTAMGQHGGQNCGGVPQPRGPVGLQAGVTGPGRGSNRARREGRRGERRIREQRGGEKRIGEERDSRARRRARAAHLRGGAAAAHGVRGSLP